MAFVSDFTALTTGAWRWNKAEKSGVPTVVTYSFLEPRELPSFTESPPVYPAAGNRYVAMSGAQRAATRDALAQYQATSGLRFVEVDDPADASIKFHGNQSRELSSWAYLPPTPLLRGDIHTGQVHVTITYDPTQEWTLDSSRGSEIYAIMLHEIGHAIGLEHPHSGVLLTPSMDNHDFTIMSYDWTWSGELTGRARDTLGPLDVDAVRFLYGDAAGYTAVWRAAGQYIEINAGGGDDRIVTGRAASLMLGGHGDDRLTGAQFGDTLAGGQGDDTLKGGAGQDQVKGQLGSDKLLGGGGDDLVTGVDGNDRLYGDAGNDILYGGLGHDRIDGGDGDDRLIGSGGADMLRGRIGDDRLRGGAGADSLIGASGRDRLSGEAGADLLQGAGGDDLLAGGADNDRLLGGGGRDILVGAAGHDRLEGGGGNDRLTGSAGHDRLHGGSGADVFVFLGNFGQDAIEDWTDGSDRLSLSARPNFDDAADVIAVSRQQGDHVLITLNVHAVIRLENTALSELGQGDFIF